MLIQGQIGQVTGQDGAQNNLRQARTSELIVSQNHGRYYEATSRGNMFSLTMTASVGGVAAGHLLTNTYQGTPLANQATQFAIWNPLGSGINMSIMKVFVGIVSGTPPGGPVFHGAFANGNPSNASTFDAGRAAVNNLIGGRQPLVRYVSTATTGTTLTGAAAPSVIRPMNLQYSAAAYASTAGSNMVDLIDGDIVIPPGYGYVPIWTTAGTSILNAYAVLWEEVPI
jgi:hypothetical protein